MPMVRANGTALYYEDTGGTGAPVVFSHGLLWDRTLFAPQIAVLKSRYRCIAYDHRGQGRSADDIVNAISMETLTDDAAALIEKLGVGPVHFCGLSLGGIVGMRLAISRPDLIRSLVLLDTTADPEPYRLKYMALCFIVRWAQQLSGNRSSIWRAANGVVARKSIYGELGKIATPTLVAVGDEDVGTPKPMAERIAGAIAGAKLMVIPGAGHGSTLEQPALVTAAISAFLDAQAEKAPEKTPSRSAAAA
jgi:3-oxoadipate enol-lactonase